MFDQQHWSSPAAMERSGIAARFDAVVRYGIQVFIFQDPYFPFCKKTGLFNLNNIY
jgi:hypothetical protein